MLAVVLVVGLARVVTFDGGGVTVLRSLDEVSTAARAATTSRFEMTVTSSAEGQGVRLTATGASDTATGRADVTMHLEDIGLGVIHIVADSSYGWIELRPALVAEHDGRHWVRFGSPAPSSAFGFSGDPAQMLADLAKLSGNAPRRIGGAKVRGVATTRYRVDLTTEDIARVLPTAQANQLRSVIDNATGRADVWVDADRLPRRIELRFAGSGVEVVSRGEMFDYGAPVVVTLPDAADTVPTASVQEAMRLARAA